MFASVAAPAGVPLRSRRAPARARVGRGSRGTAPPVRAGAHFDQPPAEELPLGVQIENALLSAFPPGCVTLSSRRPRPPSARRAVPSTPSVRPATKTLAAHALVPPLPSNPSPPRSAVDRVRDSLRFTLNDGVHDVHHPGMGHQQASSYIAGLTPRPYWDARGGDFPWMEQLERDYETIRDELRDALRNPNLERQGNAIWVAAARDDAEGYGPDWRTLVLQDRCEWEPTNVGLFPKTVAAVKAAGTPSVEVFFAKQAPQTGIKPHTDFTNFIMTSHLGLDCPPPPESWMKVGEVTKHWENGVGMCADTSFIHSTRNDSETQDRYVLIVRHWHPELTMDEREGVRFLFEAFDDLTPAGLAAAANRAKARRAAYPDPSATAPRRGEPGDLTTPAGTGTGTGAGTGAGAGAGADEEAPKRAPGGKKKNKRNKRKAASGDGLGLLAKGMK